MPVSSGDIKIALLSKYRFKMQQVAADEVKYVLGITDMSAWKNGILTEIEIKISKSDLVNGEKKKKSKHKNYLAPASAPTRCIIPNYFWVCVPSSLVEDALLWVKTVNPKYGVLEYKDNFDKTQPHKYGELINIKKRASKLHNTLSPNGWKKIAYRASSANIGNKIKLRARVPQVL